MKQPTYYISYNQITHSHSKQVITIRDLQILHEFNHFYTLENIENYIKYCCENKVKFEDLRLNLDALVGVIFFRFNGTNDLDEYADKLSRELTHAMRKVKIKNLLCSK